MGTELLNEIIEGIDCINKNITNCMENGMEFEVFGEKANGLTFIFNKNSTDEFIELYPTYNNKIIFKDIKNDKVPLFVSFNKKDLEKCYLDFDCEVVHEDNEFIYRISVVKINKEIIKAEEGFIFKAKFKEYKKYLLTQNWKNKRKRKLEEAKYKCQLCGKGNAELHVHHNNYDNLCFEEMSDLVVLCKRCHEKFHDI